MRKHSTTAGILSVISMGLGQLYNRQWIKGLLFLAIEVVGIIFTITDLATNFAGLFSLGDHGQHLEKVGRMYVNVPGDNSIFMMIYGLVAVIFFGIWLALYILNIRDAYHTGKMRDEGKAPLNFIESVRALTDRGFPYVLLSVPFVGVLFFTILPIIFMVLMAFTNYNINHVPPKNLVDWVGFDTFHNLFYLKQ